MKRFQPLYALAVFAFCLLMTACQKNLSMVQDPVTTKPMPIDTIKYGVKTDTTVKQIPFPQTESSSCNYTPNYGDTIVYPQPTSGADYIVSPLYTPPAGKFYSWPQGIVIDSITGAINLTKSETGLKYAIGFVKQGTTDTCLSILTVGGASYLDSIYILDEGATTAAPYFDANTLLPSVCAGGGCTFSSSNSKVIVNTVTGVVDLDQTLNGGGLLGGAFGILPLNGTGASTTLYYRLNDASNDALQHIDLQLVYYYSKSQIGTGLLSNVLSKLVNALSGNMISTAANPRPPLLVIVRRP